MPNRFVAPWQQFFANPVTGAPLALGQLFFYASGTSTPLATYKDSALTSLNTNPVILDSNGFGENIFLQNLAYKVVLEDANNNTIWTADPVYASDFSTFAQIQPSNGNPNGQLAGTQGSVGVPASVAWDFVNNILYVCTLTGSATGTPPPQAVWTAVNPGSTSTFTAPPTGRLTLTAGTPVIGADVVGASAVIYTATVGNTIPIFGGSSFSTQAFAADLVLTLSASQAANTLYDVFAFLNSGVLTLVTGPAWTNSAPGSCARGTGGSTTQLTRISGIWTNAVQISGKNGASTFTIPANQATYLGTIYMDATAGQVTCHVSAGQNRKYGVWNAYNRELVAVQANDPTGGGQALNNLEAVGNAPSAYSATVFNVGSGTAANGLTVLTGLAEEAVDCDYQQNMTNVTGTTADNTVAIGLNSVTVTAGVTSRHIIAVNGQYHLGRAELEQPPSLGLNVFAMLVSTGTVSMNYVSVQGNRMVARYRA